MLKIKVNSAPDAKKLMNLFSQVEWARNRRIEDVEKMLKNKDWMVCIYEGDELLGFARIITDGCFRGLLDDVIVDQNRRGTGLGEKLMHEILELSKSLDALFLNAAPEMEVFYAKFGFKKFEKLTMLLRK